MSSISVVIPNLNGAKDLAPCLDSLIGQKIKPNIIVVDNASSDSSVGLIEKDYPSVEIIKNSRNRGYAGGVNPGLERAIERGDKYVAVFNNDAIADNNWLKNLAVALDTNPGVGIITGKILGRTGKSIDSTGEQYSSWGLPFPRGRGEADMNKYDLHTDIFAGSGGASLLRVEMLKEIGLLDEDFFAYYEDVDLSFRAQLAGWKVKFAPEAIVYHRIGATSSRMSGFVTQQTVRNLPMLYLKNMPRRLFWKNILRFKLAYWSIFFSSVARGNGWPALKGLCQSLLYLPKKLWQRRKIQSRRKVSVSYIDSIIVRDLPTNANKLRSLRSIFWKLTGRQSG